LLFGALACEPAGSTTEPDGGARLNAPDDADAEYPPTCSELGPSTCSGPCQRDEAAACLHLAEGYMAGAGLARDPKRALGLMQKSCDLGFARACGYLAMAIGRNEPARAKQLGRKGCDAGYGGACVWYVAHHVVAGVPPNWREAAPLLQRGCEADHARACLAWGDVMRSGLAGQSDPAGAALAWTKACEGGSKEGCDRTAEPPTGMPCHSLSSDSPPRDELVDAGERGHVSIKVEFCVAADGTTQVESITGAPRKLEAIVRTTVEGWRWTPPAAGIKPCSAQVFEMSFD